MLIDTKTRFSGIDELGDVSWGTHFCLFYETKEDLLNILIPYFKAGLENQEYCLCITSDPFIAEAAEPALREAMPDFEQRLNKGQIEIIPHTEWYLQGGYFDPLKVRQGWVDKLNQALAQGYAGMRFVANISWLEKQDWDRFAAYEGTLEQAFHQSKMIGICAYSLERCLAVGVLDVVRHHQFTLARRDGVWESLEGVELKRAHAEVQKINTDLEHLVEERTAELAVANDQLRREILERKRIEEALKESRERMQVALQAAQIGTGEWDIQTNQSSVSNGLEQIFGYAPGAFRPGFAQFIERVHPEDRERFRTSMEEALAGKGDFALDYRIIWPDGSIHWITSQAQIFFDDTGRPTRLVGAAMDITERKLGEEALRISERKLIEAQRIAHVGYWERDVDSGTITWSDEVYRIFGISPEERVLTVKWVGKFIHPDDQEKVFQAVTQALQGGRRYNIEYRVVRPNGEVRIVHSQGDVILDDSGKPHRLFGVVQDITERKRAEDELKKFELIFSNTPDGISLVDKDYRYQSVNAAYEKVSGLKRKQLLGRTVPEYLGKQIFEEYVKPHFDRCLAGEIINYQEWFHLPTLGKRFVDVTYFPFIDAQDQIAGVVAMSRDITERKQAEEALRESEWRYREIFDNVLDALYLLEVTPDGGFRTLEVNPALERLTGIPRSFSVGKLQEETVPSDVAAIVNAKFRHCVEVGRPIEEEVELDLPSGRRYFQSTLIPARDATGQIHRIIGISHDVTERKRSEEALLISEARLQAAIDAANIGLWDWDLISGQMIGLGHHDKLLGFAPGTFDSTYSSFEKQIHPEDLEELNNAVQRARNDRSEYAHEYRVVWPDGSIHWIAGRGRFVYSEMGQPVRMYGAVLDITERKQAEEAIKQREEQLKISFEAAKIGTGEMDLQTNQITLSNAMRQVIGFPPGTFKATFQEYAQRVYPEDRAMVQQLVEGAIAGQPEINVDYRIVWPDGSIHWVTSRARTFYDEAGKAIRLVGAIMDITGLKQVEEALRISEQKSMEAQRVAHVGYWERDADSDLITWSDEVYRIFGISPDEDPTLTISRVRELIHPYDRGKVLQIAMQLPRDKLSHHSEYRIVRPNGEVRIVQGSVLQSYDDAGKHRLFGVVQDITERRQAEELIRHQSARSQLLADISRTLAEVGLDYQNVMNTVVKRTAELIGDLCVIGTYSNGGKQNMPTAAYHRNPRALELIQKGYEQNWHSNPQRMRKLLSNEIIYVPVVNPEEFRATLDPVFWPYFDEVGISSLIYVPLQVQGQVVGVLGVLRDRYGPPYTHEDQAYLKDIADRAALTMQNARLFEQVQASQGRLRVLSHRLVDVQESEQRRLAREIHDDISQTLAVLVMQLGTARNLLPKSAKKIDVILERSEELTEETLEHTRSIIAGLRPQVLDDLGLLPALRHLGEELHHTAGVIVKVRSSHLPKRLPSTIEITLFRIVQEALANIRKHAKADHATISLIQESKRVVLSVQDDGIGFEMQSGRDHQSSDIVINGGLVIPAGHFGLIGIQEQVMALGGSFQMKSAPGEGTWIQVELLL